MINLLTIQETSRTGTPPPEPDRFEKPVNGREFSEYLRENDSVTEKQEDSYRRVETESSGRTEEQRRIREESRETGPDGNKSVKDRDSGKAEAAGKGNSRKYGKSEGTEKKPDSGASEGKTILKREAGVSLKLSGSGDENELNVSSALKAMVEESFPVDSGDEIKASGKNPEKNLFSNILPDSENEESLLSGEMVSGSAELLEETLTGILPGENSQDSEAGGDLADAKKNSAVIDKLLRNLSSVPEDSTVKIELTDVRKKTGKTGSILTALGRSTETASGTGSQAGTDSAINPTEGLFTEAGDEGGETPFRVVELGPSIERSDNAADLSAGRSEVAGSFKGLLQDKGVPGIVKETGILLKDNNQGEIRLILKPESLGKVRIRLNLDENNIAGRIFVENINVKDAFNSTLEDLQRALREAGFDTASLEVFVQGEGTGESGRDNDRPVPVHSSIIESIEENIPLAESAVTDDVRVNLLA